MVRHLAEINRDWVAALDCGPGLAALRDHDELFERHRYRLRTQLETNMPIDRAARRGVDEAHVTDYVTHSQT